MTLPKDFLQKIESTIRCHRLLNEGEKVLVALSGGADSVALLLSLKALGYETVAAHCNFHLRGAESDRDETFVSDLCRENAIELHIRHFDTTEVARREGISIEMAARNLRYDFFAELRETLGAARIAVAHHRDDNIETMLLNLVRGTGLHGLTGMAWRNADIVRPMLHITRKDIKNALHQAHQPFVIDSSNTDTHFKRNKIRHELLPLLRTLNPSADDALAAAIERLNESERLCQYAAEALRADMLRQHPDGKAEIDIKALTASPAPGVLLHEWLTPYGFKPSVIADIIKGIDGEPGATYESADYIAVRDRGALQIARRPVAFSIELPESGTAELPDGSRLHLERLPREALSEIPRDPSISCLDLATLCGNLSIRTLQPGDRFVPLGMSGSKLVSDFLTDRKRSRIEKLSALALCDTKNIVALIGERPSDLHAITSATRHVLIVRHEPPCAPNSNS